MTGSQGNPPLGVVGAVVVAAGSSSRMQGADKIFSDLAGAPCLAHVLDQLEAFPPLQRVAVVTAEASVERCRELVGQRGYRKVVGVCPGGARRQDSVRLGLESLARDSRVDWLIVHDGARPCLDQEMLQRGLETALASGIGAAVAGVPVKDTIKTVSASGEVTGTPPRETLWAAQTPQVFRYELLMEAHRRCAGDFTDDAAMVESLGYPVTMFLGSYRNLKVTTPEDLAIAELFLGQPGPEASGTQTHPEGGD